MQIKRSINITDLYKILSACISPKWEVKRQKFQLQELFSWWNIQIRTEIL
jgi:hypothetical protein